MFLCSHASDVWPLHDPQLSDDDCHINLILSHWSKVSNDLYYKKLIYPLMYQNGDSRWLKLKFVGYSAVHPSDFIYDVPNGFTGYLLLLFDSPSELLIDGRLMRTAANSAILYTPGSRIYYRAAGEEYRNDWIRFRSDHSFVKLFPLTNTPFP